MARHVILGAMVKFDSASSSARPGHDQCGPRRPAITAAEARRLREHELFERLERLLIETRGNIAEIGRRMGRDRSTIRYHLRRFGMLDERTEEEDDREGGA